MNRRYSQGTAHDPDAPFPLADPDDEFGAIPPPGWMAMPVSVRYAVELAIRSSCGNYDNLAVERGDDVLLIHFDTPEGIKTATITPNGDVTVGSRFG